ncbi:MAG: DUF424 family protein [Candidatus Lokiarchaeota archaeon]|nr:DUF424 family protein [Candidatus Lokiarchaeota archaeon]MCK4779342.1 DUF424 family protein [Candidatus Lokiarchaeota archaeon]TKJ22530.1 MAG: hypothetical protein CEE43_06470 [Candidatus Lokiarchaeota archaeon Loki_b32]
MKVYLKVHIKEEFEIIACCDEELLNQVFKEGNLRIEISNQFFEGKLIALEEAISILKCASFFNIVGEKIINEAINCKLLIKEGIRFINGIPMALKMMF